MRRAGRNHLAGDEPVEQHAQTGEMLLDGRAGPLALKFLDVGGHMERLDLSDCLYAPCFAPAVRQRPPCAHRHGRAGGAGSRVIGGDTQGSRGIAGGASERRRLAEPRPHDLHRSQRHCCRVGRLEFLRVYKASVDRGIGLHVSCWHGLDRADLALAEIESVMLRRRRAAHLRRTNGFSSGGLLRGNFCSKSGAEASSSSTAFAGISSCAHATPSSSSTSRMPTEPVSSTGIII